MAHLKKLLIRDYEEDTIYLHQLIVSRRLFNKSPTSLKVETFLRVTGLKYQKVKHSLTYWTDIFNPYSKFNYCAPCMELNGKSTVGGEPVIEQLCDQFGVDLDGDLTPEQRMVDHSVSLLLNHHTNRLIFYHRFQNSEVFMRKCDLPDQKIKYEAFVPQFVSSWARKINAGLLKLFLKKYTSSVLEGKTPEDAHRLLRKDLKVLGELLAGKEYLFGNKLHLIDCRAFSMVSGLVYESPFEGELEKEFDSWMRTEVPNLIEYADRIAQKYWPDWNDLEGNEIATQ